MPKKNLTLYLAIVFIVIAGWGLYNDLGANRSLIKDAFKLVNLGFIVSREPVDYYSINYANAIFDALLLLGSIAYLTSSGRETRLLRTALGIIFLSSLMSLCYNICFLLFPNQPAEQRTFNAILISVLFTLKYIALIYCSQRSLSYFNKTKEFDTEVYEHNNSALSYSVTATKGQRITNALLDGLIAYLIFSPSIQFFLFLHSRNSASLFHRTESGMQVQLVIFVACRIVYYIIFESVFAATPAKMMTETRVMEVDGDRPGFARMLGRTLCRLIPFEGLSFLTNAGLHDRLSSTSVVCEKRTGRQGGDYYLIPPVMIVLIVGFILIKKVVVENRINTESKTQIQDFKDDLQRKLEHIGTNDFIALQVINYSGSGGLGLENGKFLKAEQIKGDSITFSIVKAFGKFFPPGQPEAEQAYKAGHDTLPHITLAKIDLKKALLDKNQSYTSQDSTLKGIKVNGTLYAIKNIGTYFQTNIEPYDFFGYGYNFLSIGMRNTGWPATLVKIDVLEGDAVIKTPLPMPLKGWSNPNWADHIDATVDGSDVDFKMNITVQDTTGRIQVYQISGNSRKDNKRVIKRIK